MHHVRTVTRAGARCVSTLSQTPLSPAQQHGELGDACLVLPVRLLLGAVGAASHLPFDVRPDAR
jgi:hypothetical protein